MQLYVSTSLESLVMPESWNAVMVLWSLKRDDVTDKPCGRPIPFYRLTPSLYAWLWSRLWSLDSAACGKPYDAKLREQVREAVEKIEAIDASASCGGLFTAEEIAKAWADQRAGRGLVKLPAPDPAKPEWYWYDGCEESRCNAGNRTRTE